MTPRTVKKRLAVEEWPPMTRNDLEVYRVNYNKRGWDKVVGKGASSGWLPMGGLDAVEALVREGERLNGWRK